MRGLLSLWIGALITTGAFAAPRETPSSYSESYAIIIKGALAGSETVVEKKDANGDTVVTSDHEMLVTDGMEAKRMAFSTRTVLSKKTGIPNSYNYWYTSGDTGDSYEFTIKDSQINRILNRGGHSSQATLPLQPGMAFVDHNVYHQYDSLVRKYNEKKGGRQTFSNYIPIIANDIPVALTYMGDSKLEGKGLTVPVRNFRVEFVGIWGGTLSVDKDGRLVRLLIPTQELEVIRRDLLPE